MIRFIDKKLEIKFKRDGFVILDVFSEDEVDSLRTIYNSIPVNYFDKKSTTYSTGDIDNKEYVTELDKKLQNLILPKLDIIVDKYEYIMSSFIVKEPGEDNITGYHQDPTMVDINNAVSGNLWIPLQDTDFKNGGLKLIKGSHRMGNILVITPDFPTIFNKFDDKLDYFSFDVKLKSGQGVLFDNKLIHGAYGNLSNEKRIALVTMLKSDNCPMVYFYKDSGSQNGKVGKFKISYDNFINHPKGKKPLGELIDEFHYSFEEVTFFQFILFMLRNYPGFTMKKMLKGLIGR